MHSLQQLCSDCTEYSLVWRKQIHLRAIISKFKSYFNHRFAMEPWPSHFTSQVSSVLNHFYLCNFKILDIQKQGTILTLLLPKTTFTIFGTCPQIQNSFQTNCCWAMDSLIYSTTDVLCSTYTVLRAIKLQVPYNAIKTDNQAETRPERNHQIIWFLGSEILQK